MEVLAQFTPDIEIYSIDEAFLRIETKDALEMAHTIKQRVHRWTGIPVAVGIGATKTLAKLASDLSKKREGIYLLDPEDKLLSELDVEEVWGIGGRTAAKLKAVGITTVRALQMADEGWIKKQFSLPVQRTLLELRGISCFPLQTIAPAKQSICCSRSFKERLEKFEDIQGALATYVARAAQKLRSQESHAATLTVFLMTSAFIANPYSNDATINLPQATDNTSLLLEAAKKALHSIFQEGLSYKKVGVILSKLTPKQFMAGDLFGQDPAEVTRRSKAMRVLDEIQTRFGKDRLRFAVERYKPDGIT